MDDAVNAVRRYYDANVEKEYHRIENRPEFLLTCRFLARHIQPGDTVLDLGGGPGRYAHWLAARGCKVTLVDLSPENARFAKAKADELGLPLRALVGDAREADGLLDETFDHVLLMGPLYHLPAEEDRVRATEAALRLLKPGGLLWAAFILMFSGMIYMMKYAPEMILSDLPEEIEFRKCVLEKHGYSGPAFTEVRFSDRDEVSAFMARFPLERVTEFGQEGILSPCEELLFKQPPEVLDGWLDMAEKLAEREELLSWAEHLMYVGQKTGR